MQILFISTDYNCICIYLVIAIEEASIQYQYCEHVGGIFSLFTQKIFEVFKKADFKHLRRVCCQNITTQCSLVSSKVKDKIMNTEDHDDLFDVLCVESPYCNWMNIKLLENMAAGNSEATKLIDEYRAVVLSRPLTEVIKYIPRFKIREKDYKKIKLKYQIDFDSLLVNDIIKIWDNVEKIFNVKGHLLIKKIAKGCVEICWLIHNDLVKHAIHAICMAVSNPPAVYNDQPSTDQLFSDTLCLEIGSFIVKEEKTPSGECT